MALSGSTNFTMTAQQLIENAFSRLGVKKMEQPLQAAELQDGLDNLNLLIKTWQAQSMHLWTIEEAVLFLIPGKTNYYLGQTGDPCCLADDFVGTQLTADQLLGDTVLTVEDTTGMLAGDKIGIKLDNDTRQWTTIVSVDSTTQITITTPLEYGASTDNTVFTFSTYIDRPLRISSFRRKNFHYDNEIPVLTWSRQQYFDQVNKNQKGTIVNAYYDPYLTNGRVWVWQTANSFDDLLRFTFESPLDDIDLSTNNLEFPVEWLECISVNLAYKLGNIYNTPVEKLAIIKDQADTLLENLLGWDEEMTSVKVSISPYAYNG